ncbi:MAG: hydantoinase B/oxoprolinase family protein [Gammaproteobacteria bacterium]|nr:hydantoinase B/oxoprolinase family protein [Gammaproteobacteria bacterium]
MSALSDLQRQLVWDRLLAVVEEQAQTLMRTAFSTVVREAGDLSAGVFDTQGRMIAQAVTGTPGHVNAMAASVGHFLERFPVQRLHPGDVLMTNDPWLATGHLNDFTVVSPVYFKEQAIALFASTSHIADVGGRGFGPDANDVFEEGIRVPVMHLFKAGKRNDALMEIVAANVRDPIVAEGDLYSLTACNHHGSRQLVDMMVEFELNSLDEVGEELLQLSQEAVEKEIEELPNGIYHQSMRVDGYDEPVDIKCALTIDDGSIDIDFAGSSPISRYGINVPLTYAQAYASFGVRCLIGNDVPNNAGSLKPISVSAPEGSILNALPPAAVSARHALGQMLPDVVIGALAQVLDNDVPAEGASCIWNPVLMNSNIQDGNVPDASFVINPIFNGGTGARATKDGLSTTAFPSGVRTTPTEINEVTSPLIFWKREFKPDSGGAGRLRGGLGQTIEIEHAHGSEFSISKMFERVVHPARGRDGGHDGARGRVAVKDGQDFRGKGKESIPSGATLVMETPGGAGIGSPLDRDPVLINADLREGVISSSAAVSIYRRKSD